MQVEDGLDDEAARHQEGKERAKDGHHRDQRVADHMDDNHIWLA